MLLILRMSKPVGGRCFQTIWGGSMAAELRITSEIFIHTAHLANKLTTIRLVSIQQSV